ncbi:MAG: histidine kinase dimerization/phospho-acceptor domain-containing protein [Candidatus Bathyarchaeia archaeon]
MVEERTKRLQEAERLAVIGETTAMTSHDLRNPLQVIVSLSYLAKKKMDTSSLTPTEKDKLKRLLVKMDEQTAYMNKIDSDLQD